MSERYDLYLLNEPKNTRIGVRWGDAMKDSNAQLSPVVVKDCVYITYESFTRCGERLRWRRKTMSSSQQRTRGNTASETNK